MTTRNRKSWLPPETLPKPTPSMTPMEPTGVEASFERTRDDAAKVDARDVATFKGNATLVLQNVCAGVQAVLDERAWFEAHPDAPHVDFERVASAVTAAEALEFAASRVPQAPGVEATLAPKLRRARTLVRVLRSGAQGLVEAGAVKADTLPVSDARGPLRTARDCVGYASFFRTHQTQARHATAVTAAQVKEAATLGSELLRELKPKGAKSTPRRSDAEREAAELRDRLAVVLAERYDYVERAAGWRWGRALEEHVPAMFTRVNERADDGVEEGGDGGEGNDGDATG